MTMSATPINPVLAWLGFGDDTDEPTPEWPRCEDCTLPAVCIGADLVAPAHLCGQCCPTHRGNDVTIAHTVAEGYRA